ncbi:MAG: serine/threonine-protein kinase [Pseudomonadota bacterium]
MMPAVDPYVGQCILGQFWIEDEIGRGGMGSVYKAKQPDMDRMVAVKVLHTRLAARQDLVQRFRREARAMSKLTHPNTARVFLFGQLDSGALYIVMEFLDGDNLLQVEKTDGPFSPARAARVMMQVCGALEEAHKTGIIHRDLKPENIVLTSQGGLEDFPKVLDFGLAKMNDPDPSTGSIRVLTQQGAIFGTPEFMSPEQAKGDPLDPRSDIYSLGIILYEMLTCKLPFKARNPMDYIAQHIKADPIPVHERSSGVKLDGSHWEVLRKSIMKDPAQRYQTAAEFADSLAMWMTDGKARAEPEGRSVPLHEIGEKPSVSSMSATPEAQREAALKAAQMEEKERAPGPSKEEEDTEIIHSGPGGKGKTILIVSAIIALFIAAVLLAVFLL